MNTIKFFASIISLLLLATMAQAESYNVDHFWANGDNWILTYDPASTVPSSSFTATHDATAKVVTFKFFAADNTSLGGCSVGATSVDGSTSLTSVYLQAVDLVKNGGLASFFHISAFGGTCFQISTVEFRTDLKKITVVCNNAPTYWGQSVYMVGSTKRLGNWNPAQAVKLTPTAYPQWAADVIVENDTNIEWKCVKHDEKNPTLGVVWSAGANRKFFSTTTDLAWSEF